MKAILSQQDIRTYLPSVDQEVLRLSQVSERLESQLTELTASLNTEAESWDKQWGNCNWFVKTFLAPDRPLKLDGDYVDVHFRMTYGFGKSDVVALKKLRQQSVSVYLKTVKELIKNERIKNNYKELLSLFTMGSVSYIIIDEEQCELLKQLN